MAKKNNSYFEDFIKMADLSYQAAESLLETLQEFQPESLAERRKVMHEIEHAEDELRHGMMKRLVKEFVTPIDREDIIQLADELDNVTDKIEDILIRMYMYNIKTMRPEALQFADVILRSCKALQEAMVAFPSMHKSNTLMQAIININTMEEEGDDIYIKAMRNLYENSTDPLETVSWSELFDRLEDCCDTCEHVANVMEIIVMKNS